MKSTTEAIALIGKTAEANGSDIRKGLARALAEAKAWLPSGYDASRERRREMLQGRGSKYVAAQLKKMFPEAADIPVLPINFAKLYAETSATFYDVPPERQVILDGEPIDPEDEKAKAFAELQRQTRAGVRLPDIERATEWCLEMLIAVRARPTVGVDGNSKTEVRFEAHYAGNFVVAPNEDAPNDIQVATAVAIKVRWPTDGGHALEVWTRNHQNGKWTRSVESLGGNKTLEEPTEYAGRFLPFVLARAEYGDTMVVDRGDDDVDIVLMNLVDLSDAAQTERLQGHTDRVYRGTRKDEGDLVGGPDKYQKIDPGEDLFSLDMNPKIQERRESIMHRQDLWERTTRSPQGSFSPSAEVPESGIARQIRNAPAEKKRAEHEVLWVELEETRLWPVAAEVWTLHVANVEPLTGCTFRVTPRRPTAYEDPEATQRRAEADYRIGIISLARYSVEVGRYKTKEDAIADGIPDVLKSAKAAEVAAGPPQSAFAAALAARAQPQDGEEEAEGEGEDNGG
jgi:hypothetical protein